MNSGIWLDVAVDALFPLVVNWVHHPSKFSKHALFEAYDQLSPEAKRAYDADVAKVFRAEHGSSAVVYRYKPRGDTSGASVSPVQPKYLDSSLYKVYEIGPTDVLVHYAQDEMPLGGKAFGHEKEIILRPGATLKEIKSAYSYDRRAAETLDLARYNLDGLVVGKPTQLYHGTTKLFRKFELSKSRNELVERFYGTGIFLTPSKRVAEQYAEANRNIGFERSIISDLKRRNRNAGWFLQQLYDHGAGAWEQSAREAGFWNDNPPPGVGAFDLVGFTSFLGGFDPNALFDIAGYIVGSNVKALASGGDALELFNGSNTGAPDWIYDALDDVGLNSKVYRPKVYTVVVRVSKPLLTASKSQARSARAKGYDSVVYHGSDLVGGVPEIAVYDSTRVRIAKIEVV